MATEVLRAHNILLPARGSSGRGTRTKLNPAARKPAAGSRKHQAGRKAPATKSPMAEVYAGPAFSTSPEPSSLPLPQFPIKKAVVGAVVVDDAATRDLRRILRLE